MVDWQYDINSDGIQERGMVYFAKGVIRDEVGVMVDNLRSHEFAVSKADIEMCMYEHDFTFEKSLEYCFAKLLKDYKRSRGIDNTFDGIGVSIPPVSFKDTKLQSNLDKIRRRLQGEKRIDADPPPPPEL